MKSPILTRKTHERILHGLISHHQEYRESVALLRSRAVDEAEKNHQAQIETVKAAHEEALRQRDRDHEVQTQRLIEAAERRIREVRNVCIEIVQEAPVSARPKFVKEVIVENILRRLPLSGDAIHATRHMTTATPTSATSTSPPVSEEAPQEAAPEATPG